MTPIALFGFDMPKFVMQEWNGPLNTFGSDDDVTSL